MRPRVGAALLTLIGIASMTALLGASGSSAAPMPVPMATDALEVTVRIPTPAPVPGGGGGGGGGGDDGPSCLAEPAEGEEPAPVVPASPAVSAPAIQIDPDRVVAGDPVQLYAPGFEPGEQIQLVFYPSRTVLSAVAADPTGSLRAGVRIPRDATLGLHSIEATGYESCAVANGRLLVFSPPGGGSMLPWLVWLLVGLALALVALFLLLARLLGWPPFVSVAAAPPAAPDPGDPIPDDEARVPEEVGV